MVCCPLLLSQVRRSGTTADKVAAMSLMVGSSAAGGLKSLDGLLALMAKSSGGKQVVLAAMEALQVRSALLVVCRGWARVCLGGRGRRGGEEEGGREGGREGEEGREGREGGGRLQEQFRSCQKGWAAGGAGRNGGAAGEGAGAYQFRPATFQQPPIAIAALLPCDVRWRTHSFPFHQL
jgi:hypothetical protein